MPSVALCADAASLQHPEALGLTGENLVTQRWLRLFSSAEEARKFLRDDHAVDEVWVASSDDVAPINLAATLKRDRPDRMVGMLSFQETGSLKSRVSATGIDASLTRQAFLDRYALRKQAAYGVGNAGRQATASPVGSTSMREAPVMRMTAAAPVSASSLTVLTGGASPAKAQADGVPDARACAAAATNGKSAFLLPVVSGSGGAGKSTIAVLSALIAQGLGYNTLLLDFDLQFGDVPALLGVHNALSVDEVLAAPARLAQLKSEGARPAVLAAPKRLEDAEVVVEQAPQVLGPLLERFDLVIANTGAAWAEQHAVLLERSSRALFLVDQRPSSLRACRQALDLCARCGIATNPFLFAVNRCSKNAPFTSIDVSCALGGSHVVELKEGGPDVEELLAAGAPYDLLESRNDLCASLERVLLEVLPPASGVPCRDEMTCTPGLRLPKRRRSRKKRKGSLCL